MEKIPMTRKGHQALETELKHLKSVERPAIIKAIAEAREHGDLSENAEYHSAKEKQSFIEGRIKELEGAISLADVIDPTKMKGKSPIARALIGKEEGDSVEVHTPGGGKSYEVLKIAFI